MRCAVLLFLHRALYCKSIGISEYLLSDFLDEKKLRARGLQNALRAAPRLIYGAWTGKGSNARGEEAPSDDLGSGVGSARKTKAAPLSLIAAAPDLRR